MRPVINNQLAAVIASVLRPFARALTWMASRAWFVEAKLLNRLLYSSTRDIPGEEFDHFKTLIFEACNKRNLSYEKIADWQTHAYRLVLTSRWLSDAIPADNLKPFVLELGGEGVASDVWKADLPHVSWENTGFDLRFPWPLQDALADIIVATEVVEHLSDQPNSIFNEGFYKKGLQAALQEAYRVLKPGGSLFITTPNAASVFHLNLALNASPPWFYQFHVREYVLNEIAYALKQAGFMVEKSDTVHCMTAYQTVDYTAHFSLLLAGGYPTANRGDDLFVLARKPG